MESVSCNLQTGSDFPQLASTYSDCKIGGKSRQKSHSVFQASQDVFTGTSKKNVYNEKGQYFLTLISESETHILYRFITHRVKYFKPLFLTILMIMTYR